ncbi:hypothetical protein PRZ48_014044 [Zasmidium cellare]|uniref:Methyltransferase n=1 Tax=Zasmidium cellare TaxID=395010 RepID=A0ABR0DZU4_ZASCE|nr:hypothetical protein PRZ48_014044 [Zasmidium cellare]
MGDSLHESESQFDPVEAQSVGDSSDSAYTDDDYRSYATSLSSSVSDFKWVNGRRFHSYREGSYQFPNDEKEQDRLDLFHALFTECLHGKLFLAPVQDPRRILDIGTGTGIWAMEVGDKYENAQVVANDLSPIQPQWVPPNLQFEVDDIESQWPPRPPFDLIHSRYMAGSITDWPRLISQIYEQTSPGGWAEFHDLDLHNVSPDNSIPPGNATLEMYKYVIEGCDKMGRTCCPGPHLKGWLEDAGFVNVKEEVFKLPVGPWPKDPHLKRIGGLNLMQFLDGLEAFSLGMFTQVLGWSVEQVHLFLMDVRRDAMKKSVHMHHWFYVVYGQKPE